MKNLKPLVTENPEGNYQYLHNMTVIKDKEVYLRDFEGNGDLNLVKYCKKQCEEKCEFKFDDDPPAEEFGEYMDCSCIVAYFYHMAVGHAELRNRLGQYESAEPEEETCQWQEDDGGLWSCSKCDIAWQFMNDGPKENDVRYCPKCGKRIDEVSPYESEEVDG